MFDLNNPKIKIQHLKNRFKVTKEVNLYVVFLVDQLEVFWSTRSWPRARILQHVLVHQMGKGEYH